MRNLSKTFSKQKICHKNFAPVSWIHVFIFNWLFIKNHCYLELCSTACKALNVDFCLCYFALTQHSSNLTLLILVSNLTIWKLVTYITSPIILLHPVPPPLLIVDKGLSLTPSPYIVPCHAVFPYIFFIRLFFKERMRIRWRWIDMNT